MSSYIKVFPADSPERARLQEAAALMTEKSPNRWRYYVGETYFDQGQGWSWTTILRQAESDDYACQALYPADQERIILAEDLSAAVDEYFACKHCLDVARRYIVTYSPDNGNGEPSHLSTYWATLASSSMDARRQFMRRFPNYHVREVELADEARRDGYGNGWFTEDERKAQREKLQENYAIARDERKEAELIVSTYEPDEFAAAIAYRDRRASEKTQNLEGVHVGDLFYFTWGYEQTNVTFFQVVGLRGKHTVIMRQNQVNSAPYGYMCGLARPIRNQFKGEERYTMRMRFDERFQRLWINAPEDYGRGHCLAPCDDGQSFEFTSYA